MGDSRRQCVVLFAAQEALFGINDGRVKVTTPADSKAMEASENGILHFRLDVVVKAQSVRYVFYISYRNF
jgi:hypothetical protein